LLYILRRAKTENQLNKGLKAAEKILTLPKLAFQLDIIKQRQQVLRGSEDLLAFTRIVGVALCYCRCLVGHYREDR
jgi:hypothetical protein